MRTVKRGEIYYAQLDPVQGSEQGGRRPVLVLQNDTGNYYSPTTVVAPITTQKKHTLPTHIQIGDVPKLSGDSIVMLEQIRTVDKTRLEEFCTKIDLEHMSRVEDAMRISLGLEEKQSMDIVELCLCPVCLSQFREGNDRVIKRISYKQKVKDTCDFCNYRMGFDYYVERNKRG